MLLLALFALFLLLHLLQLLLLQGMLLELECEILSFLEAQRLELDAVHLALLGNLSLLFVVLVEVLQVEAKLC